MLALIYFSPIWRQLPAQTSDFIYKLRLKSVNFYGPEDNPEYKLTIHRDDPPQAAITDKAWEAPDIARPVAFLSGLAPVITAEFEGCSKPGLWAKGDGPGGFDAPPFQLIYNPSYNLYQYENTLQAVFPANKIDYYDPFEITWYVSNSANGPWKEVGKSANPLYVIYSPTPVTFGSPAISPTYHHSLLYYGCKNGKGMTNPQTIVDEVYTKTFGQRKVPRRDNPSKAAMTYWGTSNPQNSDYCWTYPALLQYEDGRCGAWADFFYNIIVAQWIEGVQVSSVLWKENGLLPQGLSNALFNDVQMFFGDESPKIEIKGTYIDQNNDGIDDYWTTFAYFFVKKWDFSNSNKFYKWNKEYKPIANVPIGPLQLQNGNWLNDSELNGIEAQGMENPMSSFVDHGIVKFGGNYYDPSYGTAIQHSKEEWENASLQGYGTASFIFFNTIISGKAFMVPIMWFYENENSNLQCIIQP